MSDVTSILKYIESRIKDKSFNLLYSSREEINVENFHVKCDGKGPTATILYGKYNTIFGGYTSKDWTSENKRIKRDENAFLFYKNDNAEAKCVFIPIRENCANRAITCDAKLGPTFGGGPFFWNTYDLQTFKEEKGKTKSERINGYIHLNGTMNIGDAYEIEGKQSSWKRDINAGTLIVNRIEVYQVVADQLPKPWRTMPTEEETKEMNTRLEKLEPVSGLGIKQYNILLIGVIGAGKSSFYNTLATVFSGSVKTHAPARDAPTSVTNQVHSYELRSKDGKPLNLRIFDIRGFEDERGYENELKLLLDGNLPVGYSFPDKPLPIKEHQLLNANLNDEIHLVCFVTGILALDTITDNLHKRIAEVQQTINKKGLPMVVVATKFDEICPKIAEDADRVYKSPKARDATKKISSFFGVVEKHIFPVLNYINDDETKHGKDRLALQALDAMVRLTKDYLENHRDMTQRIDDWSQRLAKLHIPKHKNEKEMILMQLEPKLQEVNEDLRVLCVGAVNCGKTSFIDSLASALRDEIYSKASGGYANDGQSQHGPLVSTTEKFQLYQMKYKHASGDIYSSNVYIGDLPGFQQSEGIRLEDVKYVIQGHVPNKYKIKDGINRDSKKFKRPLHKKDKVHCVCNIFDISANPNELHEKIKKSLLSLQRWIREKEIPYIVVLTKGDLISDAVKESKLNVFENKSIREYKDKLTEMFKFKESKIFPVINYVHEHTVMPEYDALLLVKCINPAAFEEILKLGKECMEDFGSDQSGDSDETDESDV